MAAVENDVSWAMKLLEREPDNEENIISKYYHVGYGVLLGGGSSLLTNYIHNRPLSAAIQRTVLFGIAGAMFGAYLKRRETLVLATRDAKLRHYISLHPEDFPEPERKKYADVLMPWDPIR